jgi:hypothetical protein
LAFCLKELSTHKEIQVKARQSVEEVLAKHDYKITHESIDEMNYIEQCIKGESPQNLPSMLKTYLKFKFHRNAEKVSDFTRAYEDC